MRWEDERYVRFYTRNTPEWMAMSWQARALFGLVLREVDRAGILKVGKLGLRGVAVAVQAPWVEVETPLRELLDDGCVIYDDGRQVVLMPNYIEAQEATQSDAARKRKSREIARAVIGGGQDASESANRVLGLSDVTNRDCMPSQNVTKSHVESHAVTSGHERSLCAVPSRAVPNQPDPPIGPPPGGEPGDGGTPQPEPEPEPVAKLKAEERYAIAYADGQKRASGAEFPAPSEPWERGAIARIIKTYLPGLRGEELLEGIRATSAAYRRARDDHGRFESGFRPKKCLDWCASSGWKYRPAKPKPRPQPLRAEPADLVDPKQALASITAAIGGGAGRL